MKNPRQIVFWLILMVSLVISIWWIFYVPYHPQRVFDAIPSSATVVCVNQNLASEWDDIFKNPLLLRCVKALAVDDSGISTLSSNTVVRKWTEKLGSDLSVLAYVPSMGSEHKPALVAASWIGNQSRLLRWQMAWIKTRDLTPVYLDNGNLTIWLSREKFGKTNLRLSLALSEGLVLACISEDPIGVRTLLEAAENYPYRYTVSELGRPVIARERLEGTPRHWGWFEAQHKPVTFQFELKTDSLNLEIYGFDGLPPAVNLKDAEGTENAMSLIGKTSDLATLLPLSWVSAMTPQDPPWLLLKTLKELADPSGAPSNALAFFALLDQDHNGRIRGPINKNLRGLIKGVKAPTLLLGMQIKSDAEADERVAQTLSKLNSQFGMELTAGPFEPENGLRITSIYDARKSFYASFEPEERVAYSVRGNWLLLASNGAILKKMLSEPAAEGKSSWTIDPAAEPAATAWANLNGIGQTVKNIAGVAKLVTMLNSSNGSQALREQLDQAGAVALVLRELDQAKLTMHSSPQGYRLKLEIGAPR